MEVLSVLGALILVVLSILTPSSRSQHEDIPYEPIKDICQRCVCLTARDGNKEAHLHHILSCADKNLKHILPRWPEEFGENHTGIEIIATFSGNTIPLLQQIPPTSAKLSFSCKHCGIKEIQSPTFVDVPNILRLDLSWNYLSEDELAPDIFRGPYNLHAYEPIALEELDLSHNKIRTLDRNIFEHTPHLRKLNLAYNWFDIIDVPTAVAIGFINTLEILDVSYNELEILPSDIFKSLKRLKELHLQGNKLKFVPEGLGALGSSLQYLSLGNNPIREINEGSISELKALNYLNISGMPELEEVAYNALTRLNHLKALICSHNPKLERLDITSLRNATDIDDIDISFNNLKTMFVFVEPNMENSLPVWKKLQFLEIEGNPWNCDCSLLKALHNYRSKLLVVKSIYARCDTPYDLAGSIIHELDEESICKTPTARKLKIPIHDPPSFLKPRSIVLSVIIITAVVAIGVIAGFAIVMIKRKLQKSEFVFTNPIRYTIVRNSSVE